MSCAVCGCSEEGSTSLICDKSNGQCPCKPNVINRQCDECEVGYRSFPDCIGKFFHFKGEFLGKTLQGNVFYPFYVFDSFNLGFDF